MVAPLLAGLPSDDSTNGRGEIGIFHGLQCENREIIRKSRLTHWEKTCYPLPVFHT